MRTNSIVKRIALILFVVSVVLLIIGPIHRIAFNILFSLDAIGEVIRYPMPPSNHKNGNIHDPRNGTNEAFAFAASLQSDENSNYSSWGFLNLLPVTPSSDTVFLPYINNLNLDIPLTKSDQLDRIIFKGDSLVVPMSNGQGELIFASNLRLNFGLIFKSIFSNDDEVNKNNSNAPPKE